MQLQHEVLKLKKGDLSMTEINKINGSGLKNSEKIPSNPKPEKGKESNVNSIMVGGIKYNKNDVIQTRTSQISLPDVSDGSIFKDATRYEVTLKDGTKIMHTSSNSDEVSTEEENLRRQAEVQIERDGTINFKGLYGVEITDTSKNDNYRLLGCDYTDVSAERETKVVKGIGDRLLEAFGGPVSPEVVGADSDTITVASRKLPNGEIQKSGFMNTINVNDGDVVKYLKSEEN